MFSTFLLASMNPHLSSCEDASIELRSAIPEFPAYDSRLDKRGGITPVCLVIGTVSQSTARTYTPSAPRLPGLASYGHHKQARLSEWRPLGDVTDLCNLRGIWRNTIHQYQDDAAAKARAQVKLTSSRLIQPVQRRAADVAMAWPVLELFIFEGSSSTHVPLLLDSFGP